MRTRLTRILATIAASVALAGTLTPAAALEVPDEEPQVLCGPIRILPTHLARFCGKTEDVGQFGRTGEYLVNEERYVWSDERYPALDACSMHARVMAGDGVEADFIGFPQLARPDGSGYFPGTQYGIIDGKYVARTGHYYRSKELFYAAEPWRSIADRGDQYPPSGTELPPDCP